MTYARRVSEGANDAPGRLSVPKPTMTATLTAVLLVLESLLVFFATLVAATLLPGSTGLSGALVWGVGLALALVCLVAAGLTRRPGGIAVSAVLQGVIVATGAFVPVMFLVGLAFAALWLYLVRVGRRIDADRRRWARRLAEGGSGSAPA